MTNCNFSKLLYQTHQDKKLGRSAQVSSDFDLMETVWLSFYGLGKFETYAFLYSECRDFEHFQDWVTKLKGVDFVIEADTQFKKWEKEEKVNQSDEECFPKILTAEQLKFWEENGYLRIPKVVDDMKCDAVRQKICRHLNVNLDFPETWYMSHSDWQGIMLQVYQDEHMESIRKDPGVRQVFADLYQSNQIIPNTEKLGYNPPVTPNWIFKHGELHWDLDLSQPLEFYVQGLVYLDDVPVNRGPLHVVPGFNNRFETFIKDFSSLERAHTYMRLTETPEPISGEKGDLILWHNTIPHAAGKNESDLPRFVQYLSYTKI